VSKKRNSKSKRKISSIFWIIVILMKGGITMRSQKKNDVLLLSVAQKREIEQAKSKYHPFLGSLIF